MVYLDTSAFVPLLIDEPSSEASRELWDAADAVATSRLLFVEAAAALAQATRLHRLHESHRRSAVHLLEQLWQEFDVVEVDAVVMRRAAEVAHLCRLRGYDAMHCASAEQLDDTDLVVASSDRHVLRACQQLGLATANTG
jgi:predicted nucleic acid-binding protein